MSHQWKKNRIKSKRGRKSKFKSLIIEKDFEPENPKQLEELDESSCKWPIGHPDEKDFYFCGRTSLKDFSYCKLHLLYAYQPKGKKEEPSNKEEIPDFIEKKFDQLNIIIFFYYFHGQNIFQLKIVHLRATCNNIFLLHH